MKRSLLKSLCGLLAVVFTLGIAAAYTNQQQAESTKTIAQIIATNPEFTTLVKALRQADLEGTLNGHSEYTVFAPTNAAFEQLPNLADLLKPENRTKLRNILLYHIVKGDLPTSKVIALDRIRTLGGKTIVVTHENGNVILNGKVRISRTDIVAKNGVIHVINATLLPTAESAQQ